MHRALRVLLLAALASAASRADLRRSWPELPANAVLPGADPHAVCVDGALWIFPMWSGGRFDRGTVDVPRRHS